MIHLTSHARSVCSTRCKKKKELGKTIFSLSLVSFHPFEIRTRVINASFQGSSRWETCVLDTRANRIKTLFNNGDDDQRLDVHGSVPREGQSRLRSLPGRIEQPCPRSERVCFPGCLRHVKIVGLSRHSLVRSFVPTEKHPARG